MFCHMDSMLAHLPGNMESVLAALPGKVPHRIVIKVSEHSVVVS